MSREYESRSPSDDDLAALRDTLDELSDTYDNEHISEAKAYVDDCEDTEDPVTRADNLQEAYDELSKVEEGFEEYDRIEALQEGIDDIGSQYRKQTLAAPAQAYAKKKGEDIQALKTSSRAFCCRRVRSRPSRRAVQHSRNTA